MALLRVGTALSSRFIAPLASRASSGGPVIDPLKGKVLDDSIDMPDSLGHSVGSERWEILAKLAGNEDPFELNVKKRAKGSVDEPTLIPSMFDKRLVGCICEEDSVTIQWMYLHRAESGKRCACGYYFKLVDLPKVDYNA